MPKDDALQELKKLQKKHDDLADKAKREALANAQEAIDVLKELGFDYELVKSKSSRELRGTVSAKPCPICKFETVPPHDGRSHRGQEPKRKFTAAELKELELERIED